METVKKTTKQVLFILLIATVIGMIYNYILPNGLSLTAASLSLPSGSELTLDQVDQLRAQQNVLIIDTRYPEEFKLGHIPGSINIPANLSRDELSAVLETIEKNRQIVTYCENPACNSSRRLAGYMDYVGYENVYIYLQGFQEWLEQNRPLER